MPARETLDELADLLEEDLELEAVTVAKPPASSSPPEARVLSLGEDAAQYFRDLIGSAVEYQLRPLAFNLRHLDPVYKAEREDLEWEHLTDVDAVRYAVSRLENLSPFAPFDDSDEAYKRRLSYWAVVLTASDGRQAFFFRAFSASAELSRKPGAAFVARGGEFHVVEERIFLFDRAIDCFVYGEYLYVLRKRDYRRIFDQLAPLLRRASRAARDLIAKVPIANYHDFELACMTDSRLADKVLAVRKRDYFDSLSYEMLKPIIDEFALDIPTQTVDGETQLVFRTEPDQRFRILKLVDDDYLASSMTSHKYEINSKTDAPTS